MVSKVIIIAFDHLLVSKIPKKRRKNEENRLFFPQNRDSDNPGQKSLGQYCNMPIFLSFLGSLLKQCIIFEIFLHFSLPPPDTRLKLGKFWIHASNIVCGLRGGVGPVWIGKRPRTQKCPKTFVHDCSVAKIAASESGVFSMPKFNIKCVVSLM